jgi:hypothetical protein
LALVNQPSADFKSEMRQGHKKLLFKPHARKITFLAAFYSLDLRA